MDNDETGSTVPVSSESDAGQGAAGSSPKDPGWYPTRTNPSDQNYWDGQNWTGRRRWTTGQGWVVVGDAPEGATGPTQAPERRLSANPYVPMAMTKTTTTGLTFNLGVFLLLVCGIALMYGSVGSWVHLTGNLGIANFHVSFDGIDPGISTLIGVNGWVTFIGGVLLVIFGCFEMMSEELQLAIFATVIAAVTTVFAIYDMFRIVQKISQVPSPASANVSVGWGLICVLSAAVLATLISIVKLVQQ